MVLIGYWPLNESSGSTAYDHSRNENHGTINDGGDSTVPGATGILGQNAYSFDGSNDYVNFGHRSYFSFGSGSFTISLWTYSQSSSNWQHILDKWDETKSPQRGIRVLKSSEDKVSVDLNADTSNLIGESLTEGWNHIAVYRKDDSTMELYQNGVLKDSQTDSTNVSNSYKLCIGRRNNSYSDSIKFFQGAAGEVRIYNHALTPREIQYLYQVGKRGRQVTSKKSS
jgi:hypothetical protein